MSQENVDAVRRMIEGFLAFRNGDPKRYDCGGRRT
jgi:hypothetical protein